jgi:thymidylate synthase
MELVLNNLQDGYVALVEHVLDLGYEVTCRGQATRELTGVTMILPDPTCITLPIGVGRGVNLKLAAVEALSLVAGVVYPDLITRAAPEFGRVLQNPDDLVFGAYGPRAHWQLDDVVTLLAADPTSRQAVVSIWRPTDLEHVGDRPCTISLQFLLRDGMLELHVYMRSNDVWLGVTYDLFVFTQLQLTVARALGVDVGPYYHHAGSLHVYERDRAATTHLHEVSDSARLLGRPNFPVGVHRATVVPSEDPLADWSTQVHVANALLRCQAHAHVTEANSWYARQLGLLHR